MAESSEQPAPILVTREAPDTLRESPYQQWIDLGYLVQFLPLTKTSNAADPVPLAAACRNLSKYDWIACTSARGVESFLDELEQLGPLSDALSSKRFACVGSATALAFAKRSGRPADLVPEAFNAASLAGSLLALEEPPNRVLFPAAKNARPDLVDGLKTAGIAVDRITAYEVSPLDPQEVDPFPSEGPNSWSCIVFTSALAVEVFWEAVAAGLANRTEPAPTEAARKWISRCRPCVLGASARTKLQRYGIEPWHSSSTPTVETLVTEVGKRLGPARS